MKFLYIDLILLAIFTISVAIFLIKNRKKLQVESKIFLLYKTKIGIRFIEWASKKLSRVMPLMTWVSIFMGFILMGLMLYLLVGVLVLLIKLPIEVIGRAPPIMPLLPYVPQALGIDSLPPFYFIHWILAIILLATTHEAAHGIFASFYKIKIKSTGFGFLGPFLAAFVEPDEKVLRKRNAKQQLSILAAGSLSNFTFAIIFLLLFQVFFLAAYTPMGVGNYIFMYNQLNVSEIDTIGEYDVESFLDLSEEELSSIEGIIEVNLKDKEDKYYLTSFLLEEISKDKELVKSQGIIVAFEDTPAFRENLSGGILKVNNQEIKNINEFTKELSKYNPGDEINIETTDGHYEIILEEYPEKPGEPYLGIAFLGSRNILSLISSPFFDPHIYAEPNFDERIINFLQTFFVWMIYIFFLVALFNMLPLGFLDGGRFIYVFALALTKSEDKASKIFRILSFLVITLFFLMMIVWGIKIS
jgi:membrane-associated protease RseP (regulator of RpoE activity)